MGNQIPTQIYPVEHYITDLNDKTLPDAQYVSSLGSTRFLKVMKCSTEDGAIVVKVFVINDPSLLLNQHKKQLLDVATKLSYAPNCLQYHMVELTDKAGFMIRQYVKSSLYDRISTRPFLTTIEKKWLAFQLLCALKQCHQESVCHGDIKLENILVSSWTWLLLADFTPIKPVLLPENNPTDYTYFFDTSRRRTCYIAPERFFKGINLEDFQQEVKGNTELTPAMDIFSAGCALAELFTEGSAPFDLTQLLAYRVDEYSPDKVLDKIEDQDMKELIRHMMQKDPNKRLSASDYLIHEMGKTFPDNFYSFLWPFFKQFAVTPILPPDDRIKRIKNSMTIILSNLGVVENKKCSDDEKVDIEKCGKRCEELILITSIITSSLRSLHFTSSKLTTLELLAQVSRYVPDDIILDRILPYVFELLRDKNPRVRVDSILTLTHCLSLVDTVPKTDVNIFPEYILPNLNEITQDSAIIVRQAYAENIATIAEIALRFLEYCQIEGLMTPFNYESEYATLQEIIQQKVAALFSDSPNIVKRTLMEKAVNKLCTFFGKQKANDVLLSHMITFLNDKDSHLRLTFFTSVVSVATYIGHHCSEILKPLLLQGLSDSEEFVVIAAIEAMTALTDVGFFSEHMQCELLASVAPFLVHPNLWIRHAVVGFVSTVASILPLAVSLSSVKKIVQPFMVKEWVPFTEEISILDSLRQPIPRDVYEALLKSNDINNVLSVIEDAFAKKVSLSQLAASPALQPQSIKNVLRRLAGAGFTEDTLNQLLLFKEHLTAIQESRNSAEQGSNNTSALEQDGVIFLDQMNKQISIHHANLLPPDCHHDMSTLNLSQRGITNSPNVMMNEEWRTMFGDSQVKDQSPPMISDNRSATPTNDDSIVMASSPGAQLDLDLTSKDTITCKAECREELSTLLTTKREEHLAYIQRTRAIESQARDIKIMASKWKPRGNLLVHLHEHKGPINKIVSLGDKNALFASCSNDGTTKLWDCNKTERIFPINKSRGTYSRQDGKILSLASCYGNDSLAAASDDGSIHVIRMEKMALTSRRQLDKEEDGFVVDMNYYDSGSQSMLIYATVYGSIVGWDLRAPGTAFKLENGPNKGVLSSIATEGGQNWLVAGTSKGYHVCWDLRFKMAVSTIQHTRGAAVRKVKIHPSKPSYIISSHAGNNEISIYDIETKCCNTTLWASSTPVMCPTQSSSSTVFGMQVGKVDGNDFVISGGSDSRLRFWNLTNHETSGIFSFGAHDPQQYSSFSYSTRVVEGTEVIVETYDQKPVCAVDESKRASDKPPVGHKDIITDVLIMTKPQNLVISSSYDGTIKLWK